MRWAVLASLLLAVSGCVHSNFNSATRRQEYSITSDDKEAEMGRKLAKQVERELEITADEPMQERVRTIGARIAAASDRHDLIYTFTVVHDEDVNAFALPGGYVFINDGLIAKTTSDDELAAVIAHEVAHVAARHPIKRYESSVGLQLMYLATLAAQEGRVIQGTGIAARAAQLSYARQDELEADRLGVGYLKAAGFDGRAMLAFLEKLQDLHATKTHYMPRGVVRPHYAQTHPYVPDRIRAVKETLYGVADYIDYLNTPQ